MLLGSLIRVILAIDIIKTLLCENIVPENWVVDFFHAPFKVVNFQRSALWVFKKAWTTRNPQARFDAITLKNFLELEGVNQSAKLGWYFYPPYMVPWKIWNSKKTICVLAHNCIWVVVSYIFWNFHPYYLGKMNPIWRAYFFRWVGEKPPTRYLWILQYGDTPWKINMIYLQITHLEKGKWSSKSPWGHVPAVNLPGRYDFLGPQKIPPESTGRVRWMMLPMPFVVCSLRATCVQTAQWFLDDVIFWCTGAVAINFFCCLFVKFPQTPIHNVGCFWEALCRRQFRRSVSWFVQCAICCAWRSLTQSIHGTGIFDLQYICHKNPPNVGEYTSPMDGMGNRNARSEFEILSKSTQRLMSCLFAVSLSIDLQGISALPCQRGCHPFGRCVLVYWWFCRSFTG